LKIGLVQYYPAWEDKQANKSKINQLVKNLSSTPEVLIFPELTLTGFTMRSKRFSEKTDGETIQFFFSLAEKCSSHVIYGFIEEEDGSFYNTLVHLTPRGKIACKYQKIHPFSFTGENRHYASGERQQVTTIKEFSIGLSICYDLRFPELYRYYAKSGVDIIIDIANWPVDRIEHWYTLLKARAIENQCYSIGVNRVGSGKSIKYPGWSSVFHPFGKELLCFKDKEGIKIITVNQTEVKRTKAKYPFINDIRLI
jgi:predicted amidohydrolase